MDNEERIKKIEKEYVKLGRINGIPMIMVGLGLHAKFGKGDEPVFEFLKNESIVNGMFIVSIPFILWVMFRILKLVTETRNLKNNANL